MMTDPAPAVRQLDRGAGGAADVPTYPVFMTLLWAVQCAVECSVSSAVCSVQCSAVCSVQCSAVCSVQRALCIALYSCLLADKTWIKGRHVTRLPWCQLRISRFPEIFQSI